MEGKNLQAKRSRGKGVEAGPARVDGSGVKEMGSGKEQSSIGEHHVKVILLAESQDSQSPFSRCLRVTR